jgi:hypothetical protein
MHTTQMQKKHPVSNNWFPGELDEAIPYAVELEFIVNTYDILKFSAQYIQTIWSCQNWCMLVRRQLLWVANASSATKREQSDRLSRGAASLKVEDCIRWPWFSFASHHWWHWISMYSLFFLSIWCRPGLCYVIHHWWIEYAVFTCLN